MRALSMVILLSCSLHACGDRAVDSADGGSSGSDGSPVDTTALPDSTLPPDAKLKRDVVVPGSVTVFTDKLAQGTSEAAQGNVHNGTSESIFLEGCVIFSREKLEGGKWIDKGADVDCFWEGIAVEVKPGALHGQESFFNEPGTWRLRLRYGIGCQPDEPLSGAACASFGVAYSANIKVDVDLKTCDSINSSYEKRIDLARQCATGSDQDQCDVLVNYDLICSAPLYVNDIKPLQGEIDRWINFGCTKLYKPCEIDWAAPPPAKCVNGLCVSDW